ncbi:MAG: hypothetical protein AAFN18_05925 [Cyanobacteria bacterium J06554_6]
MTSQKDKIQTLIADIEAMLGKSSPRLPWVMSTEVTQQRQLLEKTRSYLQSLARNLDAPGGWGPVDPDSGQIASPSRRERTGEAEAAQVLQALLLEMQYLKENSLKPLRQELTSLKQQRQTLQSEISSLEAQKLTADNTQQQINQFLETLMERLQANLSQQVAEAMARVSAGQTSDQMLAEAIEGEFVAADQPRLHPAQRLEQLRLVQAQSDQLLLQLDTTLQTVFESLQKSVESYRESLSEGLEQMHSLGREGEVIFHALVNHIAQQLGQDTSRYLSADAEASSLTEGSDPLLPQVDQVDLSEASPNDADADPLRQELDDLSLSDELEGLDISPATLEALQTDDADELGAELDTAFDLPLLSDEDLTALQDEELTVLQTESPAESDLDLPADAPAETRDTTGESSDKESADVNSTNVDSTDVGEADTILALLDPDESPLVEAPPASDLDEETFDTLFGETAMAAAPALDAQSMEEAQGEAQDDLDLESTDLLAIETAVQETESASETTEAIDPAALAEAEAWLFEEAAGLTDLSEDDSSTEAAPLSDSATAADATPIDETLDNFFGAELAADLADSATADPASDTIASLADLLPEADTEAPATDSAADDYALAAASEDLLTASEPASEQRFDLDIDSSLMDQLETDLQTLGGGDDSDPLPGSEVEPLNSLLDQNELENLVADLDLAEPDALSDASDTFNLVEPLGTADESAESSLDNDDTALAATMSLSLDELMPESEPELDIEGLDADLTQDLGASDLPLADLDLSIDDEPLALSLDDEPADQAPKLTDLATELGTEKAPSQPEVELSTDALSSLTLEDLSGLSEPAEARRDDAAVGPDTGTGTLDDLGLLLDSDTPGPTALETEHATDQAPELENLGTESFEASDLPPLDLSPEADSFLGAVDDGPAADPLFDSIDFEALGAPEPALEDSELDFGTDTDIDTPRTDASAVDLSDVDLLETDIDLAALGEDGSEAGFNADFELPATDLSESASADEDDPLEIGDLSPELATELEGLSAQANELAEQADERWDGLLPDLEEPILSDLPAPDFPELTDAEPQLETAYLPDLPESGEAIETLLDPSEDTATADLASADELSAFAAALATVPAPAGADPATEPRADEFSEFGSDLERDNLDINDNVDLLDRANDAATAPPPLAAAATEPTWFLGLDIGTTGLSAVLMNRTAGQVYPLYWQGPDGDEKWFRLPAAVWLAAPEPSNQAPALDAVGHLAWAKAQQTETAGVLLNHLKPLLKVAVPYSTADEGAEPKLQWSDQTQLPLQQVQLALQSLLQQCLPSEASALACQTIGLEAEELQQALHNLQSIVVGYPTNWPDTYSFNLREAILGAGLVARADQIFFIEDAIASLLSGLADPSTATDDTAVTRQPSLYNCRWQGGTIAISAGATLTELTLVNLPDQASDLTYGDFGQRSFPYAGDGLDQDIICQLLAAEGARQPLPDDATMAAQDWSWRAELPEGAEGHWESLQLANLTLPIAGETALVDRHRLQQRLQSSPLGLSLLEAARHLKLILQHQAQFQLDLGHQRWLIKRRDLESRIFLPYIQRINRHLNVLLSQKGLSAQAIKQVVCTGGSASLPAIARWLRQKFPNATIVQDTYASDRPQSCSRVAYGLVNLVRYPQVLDINRHQYSDYFLLMELLRVFPAQPLPVSGIMHLLEQRGINTKACQLHILALLEGHLPPGLVPTASDRPWISDQSEAMRTYQALTAAPLFTKQSNQIYVPNETQSQRLSDYLAQVITNKAQSLEEPLIAQLTAVNA